MCMAFNHSRARNKRNSGDLKVGNAAMIKQTQGNTRQERKVAKRKRRWRRRTRTAKDKDCWDDECRGGCDNRIRRDCNSKLNLKMKPNSNKKRFD